MWQDILVNSSTQTIGPELPGHSGEAQPTQGHSCLPCARQLIMEQISVDSWGTQWWFWAGWWWGRWKIMSVIQPHYDCDTRAKSLRPARASNIPILLFTACFPAWRQDQISRERLFSPRTLRPRIVSRICHRLEAEVRENTRRLFFPLK